MHTTMCMPDKRDEHMRSLDICNSDGETCHSDVHVCESQLHILLDKSHGVAM